MIMIMMLHVAHSFPFSPGKVLLVKKPLTSSIRDPGDPPHSLSETLSC